MLNKIKDQFKVLLQKSNVRDYDNAISLMTSLLINQTQNNNIKRELVDSKYGKMIKEILLEVELSDKNNTLDPNIDLPPILKERKKMFLRTKIEELNDFIKETILPAIESYDSINEECIDLINELLQFKKDKVLSCSKKNDWNEVKDFIMDYIKYIWENPTTVNPSLNKLTEKELDELETFLQQEVPKPKEEEKKPTDGKSNHRIIIYFITDSYFRDKYASVMRDYSEEWIEANRSMLGADSIAMEFFKKYRDKFRKDLHPEDRTALLDALSKRIDTYLKAKNIQDLYEENIEQIKKSIADIIQNLIKDVSKHKIYSKMTGIEIIGRIYELLCMDSSVGAIVSGVPDATKKNIRKIILKKYKKHELFHMLQK
jgi:hypothetical protein